MQARAEEDELRRAKERLTLKHKNTSRWARRTLKRGLGLATDEQREALHEQLRLGRELRTKAESAHAGSDSEARCDHAHGFSQFRHPVFIGSLRSGDRHRCSSDDRRIQCSPFFALPLSLPSTRRGAVRRQAAGRGVTTMTTTVLG